MAAPKLIRYSNRAEFCEAMHRWDDLWQRSSDLPEDVSPPSAMGESILAWLDQFAPRDNFVVLGVEHDGQLIAGLPLVERRLKHTIAVGTLPWNPSGWAGDLLVDPMADMEWAVEMIAQEVRRLPWPLLWFDAVPLTAPRWAKFVAALKFVGASYASHKKFEIGTIEVGAQLNYDWEAYQAAWSGNHRRHMRKSLRKANEDGGVELDIRRPSSAAEAETLLREGFEVEHRSWKGGEQTSVLCAPAVWNFYREQAISLARRCQLELVFLRHQGQAIAFEYGWRGKETYFTPKVGYDNAYARFSPGQILRYLRLEQAFSQRNLQRVDFSGPLSEATAKWATSTYPVSRLVVETGGSGGRALLWAYQNLWGRLRQWRSTDDLARTLQIVHIDRDEPAPLPS